jgi:hypothetical protein
MALPATNTNNILLAAPGSIPSPAVGYVTYFFNTSDGNKLYYKNSDGSIVEADATDAPIDACVCSILCDTVGTWNKGLLAGIFSPATYLTQLTSGLQVVTPNGTYTVGIIT